jgi:osmoprotectant transport system permease protein
LAFQRAAGDADRDSAGIAIAHRPRFNKPVLGERQHYSNDSQPALFGFCPCPGWRALDRSILALTLYALLPIIRNTFIGIRGVIRGG